MKTKIESDHRFHVEIDVQQKRPKGETACGDVFESDIIQKEGRTILVLSDGMGHGVRASVLATLTATMALKYAKFHTKPQAFARIILNALPTSSDGKENYATFTVIEIDDEGFVRIINYDNPKALVYRKNKLYEDRIYRLTVDGEEHKNKVLNCYEFYAEIEDRIVFMSDGVTQSGLGNGKFLMGWGRDNVDRFIESQLNKIPNISATKLAKKVINQAAINDNFNMKDDTTCGVIYFREPRKFMLITGPPFYRKNDFDFVGRIKNFNGKKVICGGTTAEIIARELDLEVNIHHRPKSHDSIPPTAEMESFEMVTEGILTLGKVEEVLENYDSNYEMGSETHEKIVKLLLDHDIIEIIVGTRINWSHQDPEQPIELELRKFVVRRIIDILENRFFKKVNVEYV